MQKVMVSACLLGGKVRYDGGDCRQDGLLQQWMDQGIAIPFCPEVAGGLPVPRPPAEITDGNAEAVLRGKSEVVRQNGEQITDAFIDGAEMALALCIKNRIRVAVLKEGSPSCGVTCVNDGTFQKRKISGMGITARLLARHGIAVFSESQVDQAAAALQMPEAADGQ